MATKTVINAGVYAGVDRKPAGVNRAEMPGFYDETDEKAVIYDYVRRARTWLADRPKGLEELAGAALSRWEFLRLCAGSVLLAAGLLTAHFDEWGWTTALWLAAGNLSAPAVRELYTQAATDGDGESHRKETGDDAPAGNPEKDSQEPFKEIL